MPSTESLWVSDDNSPDPVKPDTSGAAYYQYRGVLVEKCRVIGNPTLPVYHGCEKDLDTLFKVIQSICR